MIRKLATDPAKRIGSLFTSPGAFDRAVAVAKRFNDGCVGADAALLPHMGTENAAREMDVLRAAVGDEKLNYFGFSYGTCLGTVYANLFPKRTRVPAGS